MKKLLLSLAGFCLLASFTIRNKNDVSTATTLACPECTAEFNKCTKPLHEAYAKEVEAEADKLKAGKITRAEYDEFCGKASRKMAKPDGECTSAYQKCCLKETKELMDKQKAAKE